jgi:hypothetical protein
MADCMTERARRRLKLALFSLSDRIGARAGAGTSEGTRHRWLFEIGHQVGELGWRLRRPGQLREGAGRWPHLARCPFM